MSLLEDILDVVHIVLEYFGIAPDMLVPVWDSQLCGQYRSIVRMIGTNLPLAPAQRVHFQVPVFTYKQPNGYAEFAADTPAIPSFADVMWVYEDEGDGFAKNRNNLPPRKPSSVNQNAARREEVTLKHVQRGGRSTKQTADPDALAKITALESELQKLRAQIAMIVTAPPATGTNGSQDLPATLGMCPPTLTSTPHRAAPPPPPPPPPLPPPCPITSSTETLTVSQLIHKRRKEKDPDKVMGQDSVLKRGPDVKGMPSMLVVLKDLKQVKLRSVERSPGGTPVRRRSKGPSASLGDPAALIAEALKRKFAQHRHNSSDKENSVELSPFGSPETPMVPQHIRRSKGRLHL